MLTTQNNISWFKTSGNTINEFIMFDGSSFLEPIITGNDVVNKKPAPDIFLLAAEKSGVSATNCIVIEDAVSGVQAAKAAGMLCIAITTSFSTEQLHTAGADYIIDDLIDAANIVNMIDTVY